MGKAKVNVIMPVYNGAAFLKEALDSVFFQTYRGGIGLIVVDDGSTDDSVKIAREHASKPKIIIQKNSGPSAARNRGIEASNAPFITFLDADDIYPPEKIREQLQVFKKDPNLQLVRGRTEYFSNSLKKVFKKNTKGYHVGTWMCKREVFDVAGQFNETKRFSEDHDLWLRILEKEINILEEDTVRLLYRIHENNSTRNAEWDEFGLTKVIQRHLNLKREDHG